MDFRFSPNPDNFLRYDFCILDIQSTPHLTEAQALGKEFYSYMSVGEIAGNAPYLADVQARGISILLRNGRWDSYYVDQSDPRWANYVINVLAKGIVNKGFDGFFLDTVDAVETLQEIDPARADAHRDGMINLIRGLKAAYPDKKIILNRGFVVFPDVKTEIKGMLIEELFQKDDYSARSADEVAQLLRRIAPVTAASLPVYIVDYVPEWNLDLATRTAERISSLGFNPVVIPQQIDGTVLAPPPPPIVTAKPQIHQSPPILAKQPQQQTALLGANITFTASATGAPAPNYQWQFNGKDIAGANSDSLSLQNVQIRDIGIYSLIVSNAAGIVQSNPAILTLLTLDSDADNIPDDWEAKNKLDLADPTDAQKDFDGDGASSLQEYLAGTDPRDPASFPGVEVSKFTPGAIKVAFQAMAGRSYTLESCHSFGAGQAWSRLQDITVQPNDRTVEFIDSITNGLTARFYRIVTPMRP